LNRHDGAATATSDAPFEAPFDAPWQAEAFALSVALRDAGLFTAAEWAQALGRERAGAGIADDGSDYYQSVLRALETLLAEKGVTAADEIEAMALAWQRAALATPHGMPIRLENDPEHAPAS
jgi:nitrile hydratase accessory protein